MQKMLEHKNWEGLKRELKDFKGTPENVRVLVEIINLRQLPLLALSAKLLLNHTKSLNQKVLKNLIDMVVQVHVQQIEHVMILVSSFKLISQLMQEYKSDMNENLFKLVLKCCFLGIPQFNNLEFEGVNSDLSSDSDSSNFQDKNSKLLAKLRTQSQLLLQCQMRQFPIYFQNNWQLLLRCKNYQEQSLISLMVHEPGKKNKINIISTIIVMLDLLNIGKWIQGYDFSKIQNQSFQPKALQLYQLSKSLHETNLNLLQNWKQLDQQLITMILKLELVLINSSQILTKIPETLGVYPLFQLFLQLNQIQEYYTAKTAIVQIMNQLLCDNFKMIDVRFLIQTSFIKIQELIKQQQPTLLQEYFQILQRVQKNHHIEFVQQSNDIEQDLKDLRQLCLVNGIIQNYYKLIEEMSSVQLHPSVVKIISQIALETLNNSPEIIQFGLNILSNITEQFWEQQEIQYIQQIATSLEQLFKLMTKEEKYNTSNLKILFYKSIGTLTSIKLLMNIDFVPQIFETFFSIIQHNNIHVLEKSSWAAANLSAIKLLDPSFYNLFLSFVSSSKEKIATNGLRGIGYYLQRTKEIPNMKEITNCYQKLLSHKNPKICWNASSSLLNALQNPIMEQLLQEQQIINGLIHILKRRDNLKAQIHGIELVQKIQDQKFQIDVIKLFLLIIKDLEGEQNNFIEQKYQKKLREQIFDLLSQYLQKIDIKILIQQLEQDLHNDEVLSRLLEEIMRYLYDQKPENAKTLFGKGDQTKAEILQSEVSEDNEKIFQNFIGQNQLVQKYLKVDHDDHFHQCLQKVVRITKVIAEIIHESNIDNFVSFSIINTLDEFGNDPYFIKLYNNI